MKKKVLRGMSLLLAAMLLCLPLAGCGGGETDPSSAGKEEITISYYTGEFGDDWIKNLAQQWNAANDKYYVNARGNLNLSGTLIADIKSGTKNDIIITEDCNFQTIFTPDYLEDLSDLLKVTASGDSKTIGDKIANKDVWMEMSGKDGATYMLPYNISPTGMIFDYERFLENGWLFDKDGKLGGSNGIHPGKDGVEGTYDDGQPQTMEQFQAMCEKIRNSGTEVFLYMGAKHAEYVNNVAYAYLAQLLGEEDFRIFYTHDSQGKEVELEDGTKTAFTIAEGYKSLQMKGIDEMIKFVSQYLTNLNYVSEATLNDVALSVDASHTQFLMGEAAFIIEGNWFENRSRQLIDSMSKYDPDAKAYGEADYRYMLVPATTEGRSVIFSQTGGGIIVPKQSDPEKLAAIKDFLTFMLSDQSMGQVTRDTGMLWNYDYTISSEDMEVMTRFTQNTYSMIHDTENVLVRSAFIDTASVPIHAYSAMGAYTYMYLSQTTQTLVTWGLLQDAKGDIQTFLNNIAEYNNAERWSGWLEQAKTYGYYNEN